MNYNNPFMYSYPYMSMPMNFARPSLFSGLSGLFKNGINWGSLLNNTQRTLGIINQAIPAIKQVTPIVKNAKTMFKLMNEFKKVDTPASTSSNTQTFNNSNDIRVNNNITNNNTSSSNASYGPTFFI